MHRTLMTLDMFMLDGDVTSKVMAVAALAQRADGATRLGERPSNDRQYQNRPRMMIIVGRTNRAL
jgi:hypothetical protein